MTKTVAVVVVVTIIIIMSVANVRVYMEKGRGKTE